ncbi:Uncharacterized protein APZ42_007930, partial [Daphnia magna]
RYLYEFDFTRFVLLHFIFFPQFSPEQLQDPTVKEPAIELDLISVPSPPADVLMDHEHSPMNEIQENENPEESIAAPQRYLYEFDFTRYVLLNFISFL